MKKVIKLTESKLIRIIKNTINEQEGEYYEISADEYKRLLASTGYNAKGLSKIRRFEGKPIKVIGNLTLDSTPVQDLGNLLVVGNLYLRSSKIQTLDGVTVTGSVTYYDTPYQAKLDRIARQKIEDEANDRRENNIWDPEDTDEEGLMANAVFNYAVSEGELKGLSDEEKVELDNLKEELETVESRMEVEDDEELYDELSEKYDEIEERIGELSEYVDVYDLIPRKYGHYKMNVFESLSEGIEYAISDEDDARKSLDEYNENLIDEIGYENFHSYVVEEYIDKDSLADYFEDMFRDDVYESPESYDVKRELSDYQEDEIWLLKMEKWVYEKAGVRAPIQYQTRESGNVFDFMDEDDNRFQLKFNGTRWVLYMNESEVNPGEIYDDEETEEQIEMREDRISEIDDEIEYITDNPEGDLDEDSVEEIVEDKKDEVKDDPLRWIKDYDLQIKYFIDKDDFIRGLSNDADYGNLNGYNGTYDYYDGYIVMRIN